MDSHSDFNGLLVQALTLGVRKVVPEKAPEFIGFIVYAGLVGLILVSLTLARTPLQILASLAFLIIVAIMAVLLLSVGNTKIGTWIVAVFVLFALGTVGYLVYAINRSFGDTLIEGQILYKDNTSAKSFNISTLGASGGVFTDDNGKFLLHVCPVSEIHSGKLTIQVQDPKRKWGDLRELTGLTIGVWNSKTIFLGKTEGEINQEIQQKFLPPSSPSAGVLHSRPQTLSTQKVSFRIPDPIANNSQTKPSKKAIQAGHNSKSDKPEPIVTAVNVPIDFKPRSESVPKEGAGGCACSIDQNVLFPDGSYNVNAKREFLFRYDGSPMCRKQAFRNFRGIVIWGPSTSNLHDFQAWDYWAIAGTLKVKFAKPGDYNVVVELTADCIDSFYKCWNTCRAFGNTKVHVK